MASIVRRRGAKVWTAFYRDAHGRQHCRSTGAKDKKAAREIADAYELAAQNQQTLRQVARVLADMRALTGSEQSVAASLRSHVEGWLASKQSETAPATHYFYSQSCGKLLKFLGEAADNDIALITKAQLSAYRTHLLPSLSARTVNHHLVVVRMLFRAAKRDGLIIDDPSEFVGAVKQADAQDTRAKRRAFTIPELEAVLAVADPEWQSMIMFGLYTGQRLMDLARLTWTNIDLERNELRLVAAKTSRRVILPLAAPLRAHIESLSSADELASHIHPRAAAAVNSATLSMQFEAILFQAGLRERATVPPKERSTRRTQHDLSFHSLRHTTVSLMHAAGVSQAVSETFAGHSSGAVHQLYIHADRESLQRAADLLPKVLSAKA
jgi:integrase